MTKIDMADQDTEAKFWITEKKQNKLHRERTKTKKKRRLQNNGRIPK